MFLYLICSYLIGTFLTAWWVGKWKKTDLSKIRSGNLGARNAGAVLGKGAFVITFLGDALKGALIVLIGSYYNFSVEIIAIGGLFAILGHLFPFWLKFKGGKGIATFIGIGLVLSPMLFGIMAACFIIFIALSRSATLSMLLAFSIFGVLCLFTSSLWPLSIGILIILIRHRFDIVDSWKKRWWKTRK